MQQGSTYYCYVDGGCTDNGKYNARAMGSYAVYRMGYGVEVTHEMLKRQTPFLLEHRFTLPFSGQRATNNMAEATSLYMLLMELNRNKILRNNNEIIIYMDSQLTINHFYGINKITKDYLIDIHAKIKGFLDKALATSIVENGEKFTLSLHWISGVLMKETVIQH